MLGGVDHIVGIVLGSVLQLDDYPRVVFKLSYCVQLYGDKYDNRGL